MNRIITIFLIFIKCSVIHADLNSDLMYASGYHKTDIVRLLADYGANINIRSVNPFICEMFSIMQWPSGITAFDIARESGYDDILRILENAGANNRQIRKSKKDK